MRLLPSAALYGAVALVVGTAVLVLWYQGRAIHSNPSAASRLSPALSSPSSFWGSSFPDGQQLQPHQEQSQQHHAHHRNHQHQEHPRVADEFGGHVALGGGAQAVYNSAWFAEAKARAGFSPSSWEGVQGEEMVGGKGGRGSEAAFVRLPSPFSPHASGEVVVRADAGTTSAVGKVGGEGGTAGSAFQHRQDGMIGAAGKQPGRGGQGEGGTATPEAGAGATQDEIAASILYPPASPLGKLADFRFVHNEDKCGFVASMLHEGATKGTMARDTPAKTPPPVYLVILVNSEAGNAENRAAVRTSFGSLSIPGVPVVTLFLLGSMHTQDPSVQVTIEDEIAAYGDILQGSHVDHFRNASFNDLMGLRWVSTFCPQAKYVFKTEDRAFFDPYQTIDLLHNVFGNTPEFLSCLFVRAGSPAYRDPGMQRWYLSREEHPDDTLEPYCVLSSFFLTPRMAARLDQAALSEHHGFSINDVYITGVLMATLKQPHRNLEKYFSVEGSHWQTWLESNPSVPSRYIFAPYKGGDLPLSWALSLRMRQHALLFGLPRYRYLRWE